MFFAKLVADQFGRGLFETYLELSCVPVLAEPMTSSSVSSITNHLSVADVMARGVMALPPVIAVSKLLHILQTAPYSVRPLCSARMPGQLSSDGSVDTCCGGKGSIACDERLCGSQVLVRIHVQVSSIRFGGERTAFHSFTLYRTRVPCTLSCIAKEYLSGCSHSQ